MSRSDLAQRREGSRKEREACLLFSLLQAKVGRSLTSRLGDRSLVEAASLPERELAAAAGLTEKAARNVSTVREAFDGDRMVDDLAARGISVVTLADADYPELLAAISDPPPALFVRGELPAGTSVAVVGARKVSVGAADVARSLGRRLAERGVAVVSGLALGSDAAAHRGALEGGGETVGVLGCGIDVVYPKTNRKLYAEVERRGAVVSEYYLGEPPLAWRFPARNRVIAGLAEVTVVVEAAERSGSLITARHAMDEGREVWAVPGPLGMEECRGSNKLLADGANVLWDVEEFVAAFGAANGTPAEPPESTLNQEVPAELPESEARALRAVGFSPSGVDQIGARSGLGMRELLPALSLLELKGYVARDATGAFARKARSR